MTKWSNRDEAFLAVAKGIREAINDLYSSSVSTQPPLEQFSILPSEIPQGLPPLFQDDPLFAIPHPTRARLFMQIKSNDTLVNGDDACAISLDETLFALCDGVGMSYFPRPWATLLANQWVIVPGH